MSLVDISKALMIKKTIKCVYFKAKSKMLNYSQNSCKFLKMSESNTFLILSMGNNDHVKGAVIWRKYLNLMVTQRLSQY